MLVESKIILMKILLTKNESGIEIIIVKMILKN